MLSELTEIEEYDCMILLALIYFVLWFSYIYAKYRSWNMDLAAISLLIAISFFAILIDITDIYGDYGVNEKSITFPTLSLFCIQWTPIIYLIHIVCRIKLVEHYQIKESLLYIFLALVILSSLAMIAASITDVRDALIMDLADVRNQYYEDLVSGSGKEANYLLLIPKILMSVPIPTLSLFLWFYMQAFTKYSAFLRLGIFLASIVQAIIAITVAGRAAMIFWIFDFYLLFSYFYSYLSSSLKKRILVFALTFIILAGFLFISITIARFEYGTRNPLASFYGYAGQHINNFCAMFVYGGDVPASYDRIFPLISKIMGHPYDMMEHYYAIEGYMHGNTIVNVFDTFGGEIYLDLGWVGYLGFFVLLFLAIIYIKKNWQEMSFYRIFFLIIIVSFFTRGLFAWPFTGHYRSVALALMFFSSYLFKYRFKV